MLTREFQKKAGIEPINEPEPEYQEEYDEEYVPFVSRVIATMSDP